MQRVFAHRERPWKNKTTSIPSRARSKRDETPWGNVYSPVIIRALRICLKAFCMDVTTSWRTSSAVLTANCRFSKSLSVMKREAHLHFAECAFLKQTRKHNAKVKINIDI